MTTIACNSEMMACDTLSTWEDTKMSEEKIFRIGTDIVGTSGCSESGLLFMRWYSDQSSDKPQELEDFDAIVLKHDGTIELWGTKLIAMKLRNKFYAIGSGRKAALAAMHMGADPKKAVEISCLVDSYTGPPVKTLKRTKCTKS